MRNRVKTLSAAVAALAALALGGSAIASATQHKAAHVKKHAAARTVAQEKTTGPDTDNIQSGDQTAPDSQPVKSTAAGTGSAAGESSSETSSETAGESSTPSDGPGGHEDPAGDVEFAGTGQE
jgi:hypothetical protein